MKNKQEIEELFKEACNVQHVAPSGCAAVAETFPTRFINFFKFLEVNSKIFFLKQLPTLPPESLGIIFAEQAANLAEASQGVDGLLFVITLFALPPESMKQVLTQQNIAAMQPKLGTLGDKMFKKKLSELQPQPDIVKPVSAVQDVVPGIIQMISLYGADRDYTEEAERYSREWYNMGIKLDHEAIKFLDINSYWGKYFLKLTKPVIEFLEQPQIANLDPVIIKLLTKTYVQLPDVHTIKCFAKQWIEGLEKVISRSATLKMILNTAATEGGEIFVLNTTNGDFRKIKGVLYDIGVGPGGMSITTHDGKTSDLVFSYRYEKTFDNVGILVHEASHKAIQIKFQNGQRPYYGHDSSIFNKVKEDFTTECARQDKFYMAWYLSNVVHGFPKTWLMGEIGNYVPGEAIEQLFPSIVSFFEKGFFARHNIVRDSIDSELIPLLTGYIAKDILGLDREYYQHNISKEFATSLWIFIQEYLTPGSNEALPTFCYQHYPSLEEMRDTNILKLLAANPPGTNWLDCMAQRVALEEQMERGKQCAEAQQSAQVDPDAVDIPHTAQAADYNPIADEPDSHLLGGLLNL